MSPVRALQVGLAVAYGAVVGTWMPVPAATPIFSLPAAVVTSPWPPEPAAPAHTPPRAEEPQVVSAAWTLPAGAPAAGLALETLPAAPSFAVVPLVVAPSAAAARSPVIRDANAGASTAYAGRGRAGCPAIVAEGESVPASCRRPVQRRTQTACPAPPGGPAGRSVICIRSED